MDFKVGDLVRFRHASNNELFTVGEIIPDDRDYLDGVIRYEIVAKDSDGDDGTPYPVEDFTPKTIEVGDAIRFADCEELAGKVVGMKEKTGTIDLLDPNGQTWHEQRVIDYRAVSLTKEAVSDVYQFKCGDYVRVRNVEFLQDEAVRVANVHGKPVTATTEVDVRTKLKQLHRFKALELIPVGALVPAPDNRSLNEILARLQEVNSQVLARKNEQRELKKAARIAFRRALRAGTE